MPRPRRPRNAPPRDADGPLAVRIIGGSFRGRTLAYSGDARTRPMKDRVREAMFNLLAERIRGKHAIDLFAGTGVLGLEALSRGASKASLIERHLPTAKLIEQNAKTIGVSDQVEVCFSDAFVWGKRFVPVGEPLAVFCSPPYEFYVRRQADVLRLIGDLWGKSPVSSLIVVEADEQFDFGLLPARDLWFVRAYPPAVVGIAEKPPPESSR